MFSRSVPGKMAVNPKVSTLHQNDVAVTRIRGLFPTLVKTKMAMGLINVHGNVTSLVLDSRRVQSETFYAVNILSDLVMQLARDHIGHLIDRDRTHMPTPQLL